MCIDHGILDGGGVLAGVLLFLDGTIQGSLEAVPLFAKSAVVLFEQVQLFLLQPHLLDVLLNRGAMPLVRECRGKLASDGLLHT